MDLVDAGIPVTLFEAGAVPGGRARRVPGGDETDDNGQHLLLGAYTELLAMMRRVGIPIEAVLERRPLTLLVAGGIRLRALPLPPPFNLAAGVLLAGGASLRNRIATLKVLGALQADGFRATRGETVAMMLDRFGLEGGLRTWLWEAICLAALNTPPERASAQVFLNILHDIATGPREASDLLIPRTDLSQLFPEPATQYIRMRGGDVLMGAQVVRLEDAGAGVRVISAKGLEREYRQVIIATAPRAVCKLLADWPDMQPLLGHLHAMPFERIATLTLDYPCPVRLPFPMMGVASGSVEWVFDRHWLLEGRVSTPGRLSCVLSAPAAGMTVDQEILTARAHADVERLTGPLPYPISRRLLVDKRATFSCRPDVFRPDSVTHDPRILLAGDYLNARYPATLETAVRSGRRAAAIAISWQGAGATQFSRQVPSP
jgi:squalene-associated FAD-dependent desaturase